MNAFDLINEIDHIKNGPADLDNAKRLLELVKNRDQYLDYLFKDLNNPEWIPFFKDIGVFKTPPSSSNWPPSEYLSRMADVAPKDVLVLALSISTDNVQIIHNYTMAACSMPPELAVQWCDYLTNWITKKHLLGPLLEMDVPKLINRLAPTHFSSALNLTKILLTPINPTESGQHSDCLLRMENYHAKSLLKKCLPVLLSSDHQATFTFCLDNLQTAIPLAYPSIAPFSPKDDRSQYWRPAIEDHEQNRIRLKNIGILADGLRNCAEWICKNTHQEKAELIEKLEAIPTYYFQRLALHLLRLFPENLETQMTAKLCNLELFCDKYLWHEFMLLLKHQYASLPPESQNKILQWIEEGPHQKSPEQKASWQRDILSLIGDVLPDPWPAFYQQLLAKIGRPFAPDFVCGIVSNWGNESPSSDLELKDLTTEKLIPKLLDFKEQDDHFSGPNIDGLASTFQSLVQSQSLRFCNDLHHFQNAELNPRYIQALISGLNDARQGDQVLNWEPILSFGLWILAQPDSSKEHNYSYAEVRNTLGNLISRGLASGHDAIIPIAQRDLVWRNLALLALDSDPIESKEPSVDYFSSAINTIRGVALENVIKYLFWVNQQLPKTDFSIVNTTPEVAQLLESRLCQNKETIPTVHCVYGPHLAGLYRLDPTWTSGKISKIFPVERPLFKKATWESYLLYSSDPLFTETTHLYREAIQQLSKTSNEKSSYRDPHERLAIHVMVGYVRGLEPFHDLNDEDGLTIQFFQNANDAYRGEAMEFLGRQAEYLDAKDLPKLQALWDWRIGQLEKRHSSQINPPSAIKPQPPSPPSKELSAFTWWMHSGKFSDEWILHNYKLALSLGGEADDSGFALDRLAQCAKRHPEATLVCLDLACQQFNNAKRWVISIKADDIKGILSTLRTNATPTFSTKINAFVNQLLTWGHFQFKLETQ